MNSTNITAAVNTTAADGSQPSAELKRIIAAVNRKARSNGLSNTLVAEWTSEGGWRVGFTEEGIRVLNAKLR